MPPTPPDAAGAPRGAAELYVVVTGLRVRPFWKAPLFWRHAIPSRMQAQRAPGLVSEAVRTVAGVHHTLTVWRDRESAHAFAMQGAHLRAVRAFRRFATGRTVRFTAAAPPGWEEALHRWHREGVDY